MESECITALWEALAYNLVTKEFSAHLTGDTLRLRVARADDASALRDMIAESVRALQHADYTVAQIEGALGTIYGTDQTMIADGTFYVVEQDGAVVGCGGWSRRRTAFGSDHSPVKDDTPLDPASDAAKIRGFFVHPSWARRGIASRILDACERAARDAGFTRFELVSTLTGVPLYRRHGYVACGQVCFTLPNGEPYQAVLMTKDQAGDSDHAETRL
jgi:GNAT superfamily N-acetyltransferase